MKILLTTLLFTSIFLPVFSQVKYNGNYLGVWTTSPTSLLTVYGSNQFVEVRNTGTSRAGIKFNNTLTWSNIDSEIYLSPGKFGFRVDGQEVMYFTEGSTPDIRLWDGKIQMNKNSSNS